jgi:xanthine dehydrogenase small subunit
MHRDFIELTLNGKTLRLTGESVFQPLSSVLRYERWLTGTKVVCAEGDCGACTVMVSRWNPLTRKHARYVGVNSCIATTFLLDGASLVTVEGLKEKNGTPCEVQNSMVRNFGGQCGFCTPGFVMAITDLYESKDNPGEKTVKNYLTGNLCRCTGYEPIVKAALDVDVRKHKRVRERYPAVNRPPDDEAVLIESDGKVFFAPLEVIEACRFKAENPGTMIFSGATDLGVRFNKGHIRPSRFLSLNLIPELQEASFDGDEFKIGARVVLADFLRLVEKEIPQVARFLNIFASPQIKNSATLIGNLANASPIADTTPVLMALDAQLDLAGATGTRTVALKDFYLGYKKLDLQADELITHVRFKRPQPGTVLGNYKISQRRDLDISCVNASFCFEMHGETVVAARISLGGVAPTTVRLLALEKTLTGRIPSRELLTDGKKAIAQMIQPISDARGTARFRTLMAQNLFEKYLTENFKL